MTGEDQGKPPGEAPGGAPEAGEWLTVAEAARRLGITPRAIRSRIKHGSIPSRARGNQGREVFVTDDMEAGEDPPGEAPETVVLMVQVARLEERLAATERANIDLRAERDRLAAELADARKPWVVQLLEALRRR